MTFHWCIHQGCTKKLPQYPARRASPLLAKVLQCRDIEVCQVRGPALIPCLCKYSAMLYAAWIGLTSFLGRTSACRDVSKTLYEDGRDDLNLFFPFDLNVMLANRRRALNSLNEDMHWGKSPQPLCAGSLMPLPWIRASSRIEHTSTHPCLFQSICSTSTAYMWRLTWLTHKPGRQNRSPYIFSSLFCIHSMGKLA